MLQAEKLHREVALLSNSLHTFSDNDIAGVKPIIEKILLKRNEWKEVRIKIEYVERFGKLPDTQTDSDADSRTENSELTEAELKVEVQKLNMSICYYDKNVRLNPDHKKAEAWKEELTKLQAIKANYTNMLIEKKYATK